MNCSSLFIAPPSQFAIFDFSRSIRAIHQNTIKNILVSANEMLLNAAKSKVAASKMAKSIAPDDLDRAIKNLQAAAAKIKRSEADKAARQRAANFKKLQSMITEMGLSASDVRVLSGAKAKKRPGRPKKPAPKRKAAAKKGPKKGTKVAPKYQVKVGKQSHKWTGRGRMPLVFKEYVAKGGSLEQCLIK